MGKQKSKAAVRGATRVAAKKRGSADKVSKIKFGSVTVSGVAPSRTIVDANVARSAAALERVTKKLIKPGVYIPKRKGVPRYSVAEGEPGVFIRELNGQIDRGLFEDGAFQVID